MGRPPKDRAANAQLDYWLRRAGFSNRELARAVTGRAAQEGERHVHPDESRVRRWRARGETPRAPVPRLIADLLSERVGARLSIADIGMTPAHQAPPTGPDLPWHAQSTITALAYLTRSELMRPHTRTSADAMHIDHGDALLGPIQRWTTARPTPLGERTAAAEGRLGAADVAELREITEAFRNLDNRHGGVLSRQAVIAQVQHAVGLLNTCTYTESTGRALFSAIADLGSVAGWMSFDAGEHRCAQRLFITALHAASEGGDAATGAHILQCMARQMSHLQHYDDALDLVGLAQYGARRSLSPAPPPCSPGSKPASTPSSATCLPPTTPPALPKTSSTVSLQKKNPLTPPSSTAPSSPPPSAWPTRSLRSTPRPARQPAGTRTNPSACSPQRSTHAPNTDSAPKHSTTSAWPEHTWSSQKSTAPEPKPSPPSTSSHASAPHE
ncbi:hypothetical protein [Streptomyces cacaoi]|uniref:hypothetical protein n=1 Tax=Streptomyces cacaoi TaxID=1898 RepID=UPI002615C4EF|nr:hypothetical protein [Streptomyces cacaoi]